MAIDPDRKDLLGEPGLDTELLADLTDFVFALRVAGIAVTIDQSMQFLRAVDALNVHDCNALHSAGREHLCYQPDDIPLFDTTFTRFFGGRSVPRQLPRPRSSVARESVFRRA